MSNPENTLMIDNLIAKFKKERHKDINVNDSPATIFEKFVGYLVTCKYALDSRFSIKSICSGQNDSISGLEMSIDTAAVVVNGSVISSVDHLSTVNPNKMRVSYVFTQAKNEKTFKEIGGEIPKVHHGCSECIDAYQAG